MRSRMLCFVAAAIALGGCESYQDKLQAKANALGRDTKLADGQAAGQAAEACVPFRTRTAMVIKAKDGRRSVAIFPRHMGITNAHTMDLLKRNFRWSMARDAMCVLRA